MAEEKTPAETPAAEQPKTTAAANSSESGKKHHHHHKVAGAGARQKSVAGSNTGNYFRSERLPDTIYTKSYDHQNLHLPVAYYERDYDGLVFLTAQRDDMEGLRAMLDAGRDMEQEDPAGDTPLMVAVKHNAINVTRMLLGRHANYNITDRNGMTPLQVAQQNGNFQIVRAIQAAGASVRSSR